MSTELERLRTRPQETELPGGIGTVRFIAQCAGDADSVLDITKQTLALALQLSEVSNFDEATWAESLPKRFIANSPPFPSLDELAAYNSLPLEVRIDRERTEGWPLRAFINVFRPDYDFRGWLWWDAAILDENHLVVAVEVEGWPFPWQSLRWLFRGAGAVELEPEP